MAALYALATGDSLGADLATEDAMVAAEAAADRIGSDVQLVDDDNAEWIVHPAGADGRRRPATLSQPASEE